MIPELGERLHYVAHGSADGVHVQACRLLLVTAVGGWVDEEVKELPDSIVRRRIVGQRWDATAVAGRVLTPEGEFVRTVLVRDAGVPRDPDGPQRVLLCTGRTHRGGTWHWPGVG